MRISLPLSPKKFEATLIKIILLDLVLIFLVLSAFLNTIIILFAGIPFPDVLLLVPAICVFSGVIAVFRFYAYISNIVRVMGSLAYIYEEFGEGRCDITLDCPKPFLIFNFFLKKYAQEQIAKDYHFIMHSDSKKYGVFCDCLVSRGIFNLKLEIIDWHGLKHTKELKNKIASIYPITKRCVHEIRSEVLEARGIEVEKIKKAEEYYIPIPTIKPVQPPKALPEEKAVKEALLQAILEIEEIKKIRVTKESVKEKKEELKEAVKTKSGKKKESLQDALFQLEEIEKIMKRK